MSSCLIFSKVALVNFTYDVIEDWSTGECVDTHHGIFDCTADLYIACSNQLYGHRSWDWTYCSFQNMPNHTVQPGKTPWTNETFRVQLEACAVQANMSLADLDRCALSETGAGEWHKWRASVVRPRRRAHHERPGGQAHLQCVPHRCLHAKPLHPVVIERVVLAGCPVV
jgi:hypothetical protein